jgi:hypothetical protein
MSGLAGCINIEDLRRRAREKLPGPIFDYMDGGAENEWTMRRNTSGFDDVHLVPRVLRDGHYVDAERITLGWLGRLAARGGGERKRWARCGVEGRLAVGAGGGNRTRTKSLGSFQATTTSRPLRVALLPIYENRPGATARLQLVAASGAGEASRCFA